MNVATYLARFLSQQGVTHLFGLPGGENVPLIEALRQAGLEYVLVHHEAAAGFAADVTGQLTGRPGVCLATVGPGAMNLLATAVSATLERSPVLAITAVVDAALQNRVTHMQVDLPRLFGAGTKGSFVLTPETAVADIHAAWELAQTPPRGAVHLALSPEVAQQPAADPGYPTPPGAAPSWDPAGLAPILPHLRRAQRPFLLAGLGIEAAAAQTELLALAEAWQIPTAVTPKAKGHFPESHPLFSGCLTAYGDRPLRQALAGADLVIGAGLDGVDLVTSIWDIQTPLVNLNLARAADPVFNPIAAADGDLRAMLAYLATAVSQAADGITRATAVRQAIKKALQTPAPETSGRLKISRLIAALRQALPPEGAVTLDVGAFKLVFLQQWSTDRPQSVFVANGLSAMGYALPGALALKLAQPQRPVVAVAGDGALLMYAGELATLARAGQPLVILVVVDEALALIRLKQLRSAVPVHGTEFGRTDYRSLAGAFGLAYRLIDEEETAAAILTDALSHSQPVLVEARINKAEYDHFR